MLKEIFDHIPQFSVSKKNAVLDQNLSLTLNCLVQHLLCGVSGWREGKEAGRLSQPADS